MVNGSLPPNQFTEETSLAVWEQSCFSIRDLQKYCSAIFTAQVNYSASSCSDSCGFITNNNKDLFCSNVNWNPTNAAQRSCCRWSHMTITGTQQCLRKAPVRAHLGELGFVGTRDKQLLVKSAFLQVPGQQLVN